MPLSEQQVLRPRLRLFTLTPPFCPRAAFLPSRRPHLTAILAAVCSADSAGIKRGCAVEHGVSRRGRDVT